MPQVLLIEDDPLFQQALRRGLELNGHEVIGARNGLEGLEMLVEEQPNVVLLDLYLERDGLNGLEVLDRLRELQPELPVIIMTGYGTVENAVEAMKRGANEYVQKPLNIEEVLLLIDRSIEVASLRQEVGYLRRYKAETLRSEPLVAVGQAMVQVVDMAVKVARSEGNKVLLCGESGTGKDVIARLIHSESSRRDRPFVVVNCGALPADLVENELFGHEQGAFPGALKDRPGKFEEANGGTLLLDQIGTMSLENQVKLLRVLEDRRICRIGSSRQVSVDVRVIATTNEDLEKRVAEGEFRQDLYSRLNLVGICLPPLREHTEDILPLIEAFLREFGDGSKKRTVSPEALGLLVRHPWPGNMRELRNMVERIVLLDDPDCIESEHLTFILANCGQEKVPRELELDGFIAQMVERLPAGEIFDRVMRQLLMEALKRTGGNQAEGSRWLGLSKSRLTYRLQRYNIDPGSFRGMSAEVELGKSEWG